MTVKRFCVNCGKERTYPDGWKKVYLGLKHKTFKEKCGVCVEAADRHKKERVNAIS